MEDFFVNGEAKKVKIARAQAHTEAVSASADVFRQMMTRIIESTREIAGCEGEDVPEPHSLEPDIAKKVLLAMIEHVVATGNGLNNASKTSNTDYFNVIESFFPELKPKHYRVQISFGDKAEDPAVIQIADIINLPTEMH